MNVQLQNKEKGFTIIEVVLVLAIAGLIFLMVFIALPALQRGQRDTQRKNDLSRMQSAVNSFQSNNRGALPTFDATFITNYLKTSGDTFVDPNGTDYAFGAIATAFNATSPNIAATTGSICNGELLTTGQGPRKVALQMRLEGGGIFCVNN